MYYSPKTDALNAESYFNKYEDHTKMVPGFTMSTRTRPMVIGKFSEYVGDQSVIIQSKRLLEEMKVFVWKHGKAQAQPGYNDDLIILESDTENIIEYVENNLNKNKKKYKFWELLNNDKK